MSFYRNWNESRGRIGRMDVRHMKSMFFALFFSISQTMLAQEISVRSITDEGADFTRYSSFYWAAQVDKQLDDVHYFCNDLVLKADIRNEVKTALVQRGFDLNAADADLLINFRIFDKPTAGDTGKDYWSHNEFIPDRSSYTDKTIGPGTLIISILDRREKKIVWQGIAEGLWIDDQFDKQEGKIRKATELLFNDFGYRVSEYTKR
jgi:hypothetical protein